MAADPLEFMQMGRPRLPSNPNIRPARGDINGRSLDELAVNPANPNYRSHLPPPPCSRCNEDHVPGRAYDHDYVLEAPEANYVHTIADASIGAPPPVTGPVSTRVAVYVGRNDTFVVAVEQSPDWDSVETFKVTEDKVIDLIKLARALGVKVQDKTGGELSSLAMHDAS